MGRKIMGKEEHSKWRARKIKLGNLGLS
jgi:hypothetical protein